MSYNTSIRIQWVEIAMRQAQRLDARPSNLWVHSVDSLDRLMRWWQHVVVTSRGHLTSDLSVSIVAQHCSAGCCDCMRVAQRPFYIDVLSASAHLLSGMTDILRFYSVYVPVKASKQDTPIVRKISTSCQLNNIYWPQFSLCTGQWRSQEFDLGGGVYVLTSHCNFKNMC